MKKLNVAVIFGSRSPEHDVSIVTAIGSIISPLSLTEKYNPIPVYIDKQGRWFSDAKLSDISFFTGKDFKAEIKKLKPIKLNFNGGMKLVKSGFVARTIKIDFVFPATHGSYGEDGSLMGLLRMADVPFVGCDMQASVIAMDKSLTHTVTTKAGLKSPKNVVFNAKRFSDGDTGLFKEISKLDFPLFVKPTHLGSSIAISRVTNQKELKNAIDLALHYDDGVIVEEEVKNLIEVTVPIMGNEEPIPALVEESLKKNADFFDFETKYMQGGKKGKGGGKNTYSRLPARISEKLYKESEKVALDVYKAIGASGIARVDLLIDKKKEIVYFNEVNPLPGGLYDHNWKKAGVSGIDLVTKLLEYAKERYDNQKKLETVFKTSFLSQF